MSSQPSSARAHAIRGIAPALRGGAIALGGIAPALRGGAIAIACALGVIAAYGNALHDRFVWDDVPLIQQDDRLRSFGRLGDIFASDFFARSEEAVKYGYYRPLVTTSYLLDRSMHGLAPRAFHVTNLILHFACTVLVYAVGIRVLALPRIAALAGALLFAVHPVHTESVTWISGRTDVLATCFVLGALLAHAAALLPPAGASPQASRRRRNALVALAALLLVLGLLSKELAIAFPVLVLIASLGRMPLRRALYSTLPYLAVIAAYLVVRFAILQVETNRPIGVALPVYALTLARTFFAYAGELFWPFPLSAYIQNPWVEGFSWIAALALLGCIGYGALAFALYRRGRCLAAQLMLGFAASLAPVSNLVHISGPPDMGFVMAERFLYLPSMFFCLGAGALLLAPPKLRYAAAAALAVALVGGAAAAQQRNLAYRDEGTFMTETLALAPEAPLLHARLGAHYSLEGRHADAIRSLRTANDLLRRRTGKDDPKIAIDLAAALRRGGELEQALSVLTEVGAASFGTASAYFNLGETLRLLGRHDEAEAALLRCIHEDPGFTEAHLALARLDAARGRFDQALAHHGQALALAGDDAGLYVAGGDLQRMRRDLPAAQRMYRKAVAIDPSFERGHAALAAISAERGDEAGARAGFTRALELEPDLTEAAVALAVLEARRGDLPAAERQLQAALARDPDNADALLGQASLLARTGKLNAARANVLRVLQREPGNQRAREFALQLTRAGGAHGPQP
jgi:tetratricopeptide (TPR) repeat protein